MKVIDWHNHYYPPAYFDALRDGPTAAKTWTDSDGNPVIAYPGDYNVAVRGHRDIAYRQEVLDGEGVDMQVITFTTPGTQIEAPARAIELSRLVNNALADVVRTRGDRFAALGTLPLNEPSAAVEEFERITGELKLPGVMVFSNVNGIALADERFWPLWKSMDARGAMCYIHPAHPLGVEAMTDYWLMPLVGFLMDTTLAAAHLVFAGVPQRFPNIRWVLGHLGGTIPYLAERLDRGYEAFPECRARIAQPPSVFLRKFYYDTVNFDPGAIRLALAFAGASQIVAGSDYPHRIGSIPKMLETVRGLDLPDADRDAILGGNAARLLGLGS